MQFGRVEGLAIALQDNTGATLVRVTVYLETSMGLDIVREVEAEPQRFVDGAPDLYWEADQWTQETIARLLIPRGWELLGATDPPSRASDEVPRSPRYALRTDVWIPPPGWNDDIE